jgi:hypothetical protein
MVVNMMMMKFYFYIAVRVIDNSALLSPVGVATNNLA